jgi:poly(3-hydroxybutyrate) depolymerase
MSWKRLRRIASGATAITAAAAIISIPARAQGAAAPPPGPGAIEEFAAPGNNYQVAEFRFWAPKDAGALRGIAVLVPGSNGDGRGMAEDTVWQSFATKHHLALVACHFKDKPHPQSFIRPT